jgi:ubiquinone/menaquinone biosynthesis C-methylase UbiE
MSPEAIRAAEENKRRIGAANVEFRKGYLEKLPLEDASVDVAISNCVVPVMTLEAAVLREALRVLKPGGRLVFNSSPPRDDAPAGALPGEARETAHLAKLRAAGFATVEVGARIPPPDPVRSKIMVVARKKGEER